MDMGKSLVWSQDREEAGWHDVANGRVRSLPNDGQGDCLFRAISHQLDGEILAPQLRQSAVDFISQHLEDFYPQLLGLGWDMLASGEIQQCEDLELPQMVMDLLRLPRTWGGAESIAAISRMLNRNIIIYQENAPSIHFNVQAEEGPVIRLLHRMGNDGRRTHYESVLQWQPHSSIQVSVPEPASAPVAPPLAVAPRLAVAPPLEAVQPRRSARFSSELPLPALNFRCENYSDPEEISDNIPEQLMSYRRCCLCRRHVGRYALLYCGDCPACGSCIRQLFVSQSRFCPLCGLQVIGWSKVFNQN